jgi:hypothetical protein
MRMMHSQINVVIFSGEVRDRIDVELSQSKFVKDRFSLNSLLVAPTREYDIAFEDRSSNNIEPVAIVRNSPL